MTREKGTPGRTGLQPVRSLEGQDARRAAAEGAEARAVVTLTNWLGLHLRPSKAVASLASAFPCEITLTAAGRQEDAKSALGLLTLGAEFGEEIEVRARGPRAAEAVEALMKLILSFPDLPGEPKGPGPREPESGGA